MITSQAAKEDLKNVVWEEGKVVALVDGPYRYRIAVRCSSTGRQKAEFANGVFPYGAFVQCLNGKGEWGSRGSNIIPVLPDGRILMVVEQRQLMALYPDAPRVVEFDDGSTVDLGVTGALEFPGGGVEPGESITIGSLRELFEETGIVGQRALLYRRAPGVVAFNSDIAGMNWYYVAFLSNGHFEDYVQNDGGLSVLALTENEVERNIRNGVISSGQAAIISWAFYQEVMRTKHDPLFEKELVDTGYLEVEEVVIKR